MTKHTPGPWEYDGKFTVCIPHIKGLTCFRTNPEDARLITAAPDLFEALCNITECAEAGTDGANMDLWIKQARAAIAKAEGVKS